MKRILVVDDDPEMVQTLCDILRIHGWQPTAAHSGEEAVRAVREERIGVVLMDVRMPGIDGVEAMKAMKAARPSVRVALMTAYAAQGLHAEAEREGVSVFPKPVDLRALVPLLERAWHGLRSVLVVDHDTSFLDSLADLLRQRGCDVTAATRLGDALNRARVAAPSVVMLHIPDDHPALAEWISAIRRLSPGALLVLYSGAAPRLDALRSSVPAGAVSAYLTKPFPVERLDALLDAVGAN